MAKGKLCIDIGGTKIIFAIIDGSGHIIKSKRIDTPKLKSLFLKALSENISNYKAFSNGIINVSMAGRVDNSGKVIFSPNLPIAGFNFIEFMKRFSRKVTIENDGNCFGIYQLYAGGLKKYKSGLIIVCRRHNRHRRCEEVHRHTGDIFPSCRSGDRVHMAPLP